MMGSTLSVGLADLAANVLAVVLVAVLLSFNTGGGAGEPALPALVPHRPLAPAEMVAHLAGARRVGGEVSIDLSTHVTVTLPGEPPRRLGAAAAVAAAVDPAVALGRPVRLNVFEARHYDAVRTALAAAGLPATELSVPAALRAPGGRDWSDGFRALTGIPTSLVGFRRGLDDLLSGRALAMPRPAGPPVGSIPVRSLLTLLTVVAFACTALWIERRHILETT